VGQSSDGTFTIPQAGAALSDDFAGGSLDPGKWLRGTNALNQSLVTNGALTLRSSGDQAGWVVTKDDFVARNTTVTVKVVQPTDDVALGMSPTYTLSSINGFYSEPTWYRFYTYRSGGSGAYKLYAEWKRGGVVSGLDVTASFVVSLPSSSACAWTTPISTSRRRTTGPAGSTPQRALLPHRRGPRQPVPLRAVRLGHLPQG
jgi:hypothetical protein